MSKWQPIKTAPKDGTRILIAHKGCDETMVRVASWMKGVIPACLYRNTQGKLADLPGDNPLCKGRWVGEACEALAYSNGSKGDDRLVVEAYAWDPIKRENILGWMPLPRYTR